MKGWPSSSIVAAIRRVRAAEDLHQRALARAILADERVDLAGRDLQRNATQRPRRAESFANAGEFETRGH